MKVETGFPTKKIAVGPSEPPMIPMLAASLAEKKLDNFMMPSSFRNIKLFSLIKRIWTSATANVIPAERNTCFLNDQSVIFFMASPFYKNTSN